MRTGAKRYILMLTDMNLMKYIFDRSLSGSAAILSVCLPASGISLLKELLY